MGVLEHVPTHPYKRIGELLPYNWKPAQPFYGKSQNTTTGNSLGGIGAWSAFNYPQFLNNETSNLKLLHSFILGFASFLIVDSA